MKVLSQPGIRSLKAYSIRIEDQPYIIFLYGSSLWLCQSKDPSAPDPLSSSLYFLSEKHDALARTLENKRQLNSSTLELESRNFEKSERISSENYNGRLRFARSLASEAKETVESYIGDREKPRKCIICCDNEKSIIFQNCYHLAVCTKCMDTSKFKDCVMCRKPVIGRIEVVLAANNHSYETYFEDLL